MKKCLSINDRALTEEEAKKILEECGEYILQAFNPEMDDMTILEKIISEHDIIFYNADYKEMIEAFNLENKILIETN